MAIPNYEYLAIHGAERWKNIVGKTFAAPAGTAVVSADLATFGGGSTVTGDNLLIGLWAVTGVNSDDNPNAGAQLRPNYTFPDLDSASGIDKLTNTVQPVFDSRLSTRIGLTPNGDFTSDVLAVLAPPPSYKDFLRGALSGFESATDFFGGSFNKSLLESFVWDNSLTAPDGAALGSAESVDISVGSALGALGNSPSLLSTSGADDGEYPQYLLNDGTAAAALETQVALDSGDYFIPVRIEWNEGVQGSISIKLKWPASVSS